MSASKVNHLVGTSALHEVHALFAKLLQEPVVILRLTRSLLFDDVRRFADWTHRSSLRVSIESKMGIAHPCGGSYHIHLLWL